LIDALIHFYSSNHETGHAVSSSYCCILKHNNVYNLNQEVVEVHVAYTCMTKCLFSLKKLLPFVVNKDV